LPSNPTAHVDCAVSALGFKKFVEDYRVMCQALKPEVVEKISAGNIRRILNI